MATVLETKEKVSVPQNQVNGSPFEEYRLRVEDYEKMIEFGIFNDDDKI